GRWISPDPLGVGAMRNTNPQSWNRYAYVLNNPLAMVDPLGLDACQDDPNCIQNTNGNGGNDGGGDDGGGDPPGSPSCDPTVESCSSQGDPDDPNNPADQCGGQSDSGDGSSDDGGDSADVLSRSLFGHKNGHAFAALSTGSSSSTSSNSQNSCNAPNNGTPPIGTPKTTAQCSIYQDGSATGAGLAFLCSKVFPNGPVSNQIRGCLQSLYNPGSGYVPIPVIIPPGSPGGGTDLNSLLPGTGAHLGCFANAAGLL
ncbi:MAG: RHS repeat-associated core domain-containing protein, partial [Edaphobacter sp.]